VILNAFIDGQTYYGVDWPMASRLIEDMCEVRTTGSARFERTAAFTISESHTNPANVLREFDSYLQVAVNLQTGYGAIKWLLPSGSVIPSESTTAGEVWLSDNPNPPSENPHVISDPDLRRYHDPRSTLPVIMIRTAVAEYCSSVNGQRPSCIEWIPGGLDGRRDENSAPRNDASYCEDPWCEIAGPRHPYHGK
jgi:hypothetical protein